MILKANCKINLGLDILRRRADGFHDLETVMFPVAGLYDEVEVVRTPARSSAPKGWPWTALPKKTSVSKPSG